MEEKNPRELSVGGTFWNGPGTQCYSIPTFKRKIQQKQIFEVNRVERERWRSGFRLKMCALASSEVSMIKRHFPLAKGKFKDLSGVLSRPVWAFQPNM